MKKIHIQKSTGFDAEFSKKKLLKSLRQSGASEAVALNIAEKVEEEVEQGMSTDDIFLRALGYLKSRTAVPVAARYSLKRAVIELGPHGYPFEKFVGELIGKLGYETHIGVILQGECVTHEVDVLAKRENEINFIECKFHNRAGYSTGVKVPLYIQSRFLDLKAKFEKDKPDKVYKGWVVTNTRFSKDAIKYGECKDLKLIGWTYPQKGNLHDIIEESGLHPVTCLTSISDSVKQKLLRNNLVLCRDIVDKRAMLKGMGMSDQEIDEAHSEVVGVCNIAI